MSRCLALALAALCLAAAPVSAQTTIKGSDGPGPSRYDQVRVVKSGPASARRVLVIMPGTSAAAGNTAMVGEDIAERLKGWQVWSISRRETLLEDHATFERALKGQVSPAQLFDYYLGWLANPQVTDHVKLPADADVAYARRWGMATAIDDLRNVIRKARAGGRRKVVLAGHSLGATIALAYASWDFAGRAGARDVEGLVLIDGGSGRSRLKTRGDAREALDGLKEGSPFLDLGGNGVPWSVGVFGELGATLSRLEPTAPARLSAFPLLPDSLRPPVPATNRGGFGYGVDSETSPANLALAHVHAGHLAASGDPRDWEDGGLTPIARAERLFIGGTSWFHPRRLSLDGSAVNGGEKAPAQQALGVRAWHARDLGVPLYAFETSLGDGRVIKGAKQLAKRAHLRKRDQTYVDRSAGYSHLDPLAAAPGRNAFLKTVLPFLRRAVR